MPADRAPLAELYEQKAAAYRSFGNGVVADAAMSLLPDGGRVLDIGCASGGLLALLRARASYTAGIELSESAAAEARQVADEVVQAGIEDEMPFERASFDLVVLADVLEHLVEPDRALARAVAWTRPGGWVVVSVPNIAHWRARLTIATGRWPSDETGTFDSGHLRFFTVARLRALMEDADLDDVALRPVVPRLRNHVRALAGARPAIADPVERAWQRVGSACPGLLGYQLVAIGRRASVASSRSHATANTANATTMSGTNTP